MPFCFSQLGKMHKLMDMAVEAGKSYIDSKSNFRSLKRKWQALESKASDIDEEVWKAELSGKKKRKREVDNWLKEVEKLKTEFPQLEERVGQRSLGNLMTGDDVENMEKRVIELTWQSQHFNGLLLDDHGNRGEPRLTTKLFGKMFEQNLERILQCLVTDGISTIGIYGMGGVGKTTLAKHVHNYLLEKTRFRVYWFIISQDFNMKRLQNHIANVVGLDISDEEDEEIRASKLSRVLLKINNFVLVFDDVWEDFSFKSVGIPLGATGGKVILTTRTKQLCDKMDCQKFFLVNTLHSDEAWELFKHTLGHGTTLDAGTEKVAKSITERCDRLPLGIITVAASMKGIIDIRQWRDALQQLKLYSEGNDEMESKVFSVLQWSFNKLSKCQQNCFLYCSLYPEDAVIPKKELIKLFISAGLMGRRETRKQEFDQGHKVLNELVSACLLEETRKGLHVKMHDLIRDMAIRITSGDCIATIPRDRPRFLVKVGLNQMPKQNEWTKDLDVVSLMGNRISEISPNMSPNSPKLSILILQRQWYGISLRSLPSSFFAHMIMSLRVLDLSCTAIIELPSCVSDMENLTALLLNSCPHLQSVPPLEKLRELRELDISDCSCVENVPQGLEMLVNLKCLAMERTKIKIIPEGTLVRLTRLQCLKVPIGCRIHITDLKVLKELEVFKGALESDVLLQHRCLSDIFPQLNSSISLIKVHIFCSLESKFLLRLSSNSNDQESCSYSPAQCVEVLCLNSLPNLVGLVTWRVPGVSRCSPCGTFSNLRELRIGFCDKLTKLLGSKLVKNLQNLEKLSVGFCGKLEEIIAEDDITAVLPKLRTLVLCCLPTLKSIYKGTLICDNISSILISECPELKRLPFCLPIIDGKLSCPKKLKKICGSGEWWESLEWDDWSAKIALNSKFRSVDLLHALKKPLSIFDKW